MTTTPGNRHVLIGAASRTCHMPHARRHTTSVRTRVGARLLHGYNDALRDVACCVADGGGHTKGMVRPQRARPQCQGTSLSAATHRRKQANVTRYQQTTQPPHAPRLRNPTQRTWCVTPKWMGTYIMSVEMPSATCTPAMWVVAVTDDLMRLGTWAKPPPRRVAMYKAPMVPNVVYASMRWSNCTVAVFSKKLRMPICMDANAPHQPPCTM